MDEIDKNAATEKKPVKKSWKKTKRVFLILLALVVIGAGVYCYRDKPAKLVQTTDPDGADFKKGEIVDYHFLYDTVQDEALSPPEENGWRLILQALGPRALERQRLADTVPWEEFPTNEETKEWFNGEWTWLCEKFKLDPHERPAMLDRMDLWNYVGKYGLTGDEPEPDQDDPQWTDPQWTYYENGERLPARTDTVEALSVLTKKPWTAEDYPVAARWIEENADFFDVLAKAARSPKLGCWHYAPGAKEGGFISALFPDVQGIRSFARLLDARACYRVGSGDISGAIDDMETITLFGRSLLEPEIGSLVERLSGVADLGIAAGVPLFANPDVAPTTEELARVAAIRASFYQNNQMEQYAQRALRGERLMFGYGEYADYLAARRQGDDVWKLAFDADGSLMLNDPPFYVKAIAWLLFRAPPVNDAKSFQIFKELYNSTAEGDADAVFQEIEEKSPLLFALTSSPEKNHAYLLASLLIPPAAASNEAYFRTECVAKIGAITTALLAYRSEHGTLPPAFTVDENGKPLQSWRVLILPYLGNDAKALYDKLRLDEPWDSEHNSAFHAQAPDVFRCPSAENLKEGETIYSVLLGDEGFFDESGAGKDFIEATKLPDRDVWNQLLVVERAEPVCWMRPDQELKIADFTADGQTDVAKFFDSYRHSGGMNYSTPAGRVSFMSETVSAPVLEACLRGTPQPEEEEDENGFGLTPTVEETAVDDPALDEPADDETADKEPTAEETNASATEQP
ncbi:MAG: DUF1559 domain-containing protein [Thermoguttaceae bacterium]|nr:DUF1559 domain-containing protein [Thermoguttaceae bacterium]